METEVEKIKRQIKILVLLKKEIEKCERAYIDFVSFEKLSSNPFSRAYDELLNDLKNRLGNAVLNEQ